MCEICSRFNPFADDWLHQQRSADAGEALLWHKVQTAVRPPDASVTGLGWGGDDQLQVFVQAGDDRTTTAVAAPPRLPVLSAGQVAHRLVQSDWNHDGQVWKFDIDLKNGQPAPIFVDYSRMSAAGQWFADKALDAWSATTGLRFSTARPPSGKSVQITFDDERSGATTSMSSRGGEMISASINISRDWIRGDEYDLASYSTRTFIHELGHALGLGHPGDYSAAPNHGKNFATDAGFANDSWQMSVMSYFDQQENTWLDAKYATVLTPMQADLLAIRDLYGAPGNLRPGDTIYGLGSNSGDYYKVLAKNWKHTAFTIVDDGGNDTIRFSNTRSNQVVSLEKGSVSDVGNKTGNMVIAAGTVIENFVSGSGDDRITGNAKVNRLEGGAGSDRLKGLAGNDLLLGGASSDVLDGGTGNDRLHGEHGRDRLFGGPGNDSLLGHGSGDTLIGGSGRDRLKGQDGNDTLFGDADPDKLYGGRGNDRLEGGSGRDLLDGGSQSDVLTGGSGADTLSGGNGPDKLIGDAGPDRLTGGHGADVFRFAPGSGQDIITDWTDGVDRLNLSAFSFSNRAQVLEAASQGAGGVVIDLPGADTVTIRGLLLQDLGADDIFL